MAAESLAGAFNWKNNQVAPRMLGFKVKASPWHLCHNNDEQELKRSSTRRSYMSTETTTTEEVDCEIGEEEEEVIETDLLEYPGHRRWAFDNNNNNNNIPLDNIAGVCCHLESMKTTTQVTTTTIGWSLWRHRLTSPLSWSTG